MPDAAPVDLVLCDTFGDERRAGRVVGTPATDGTRRGGRDAAGVLAVDHGALRIGYFEKPGWGRQGVAYGPYRRTPGLALSVFVLNGHNNAQTTPEPEPAWRTAVRRLARLFAPWWPAGRVPPRPPSPTHRPPLQENLAVGWFDAEVPAGPRDGHAFVVRATGGAGGDLYASGHEAPVARSIQNVPVYYVVVLRERGAAFYAASLPGAAGFGAYPSMRPLAIEAGGDSEALYAGVWQSVLGEIGFHVDTRVYGVRAAHVPGLERWSGTAHAADRLGGDGPLADSPAESGGTWTGDAFARTPGGARPDADGTALLDPGAPSGLLHALVRAGDAGRAGLVWRAEGPADHWRFEAGTDGCRLVCAGGGSTVVAAEAAEPRLVPGRTHAIQVLDDGRQATITLDGAPVFAGIDTAAGPSGHGVGLYAPGAGDVCVQRFEAHPREVPLPAALAPEAPWLPAAGGVVVEDAFAGPPGDLAGRVTERGGRTWRRVLGRGHVDLGGGAARVRASAAVPNPGRTAYAVEWDTPGFAEVEVTIHPPGTRRGDGENGRGGIVIWQDEANYFIVNTWLDDVYEGTSISSFFVLGGREDLFRAVWTNVGRRVTWGVPYRLRVATDGNRYLVSVDDEPVLYRALQDVYPRCAGLAIRRVGLAANWEWGDDTGSRFVHFTARSSRSMAAKDASASN